MAVGAFLGLLFLDSAHEIERCVFTVSAADFNDINDRVESRSRNRQRIRQSLRNPVLDKRPSSPCIQARKDGVFLPSPLAIVDGDRSFEDRGEFDPVFLSQRLCVLQSHQSFGEIISFFGRVEICAFNFETGSTVRMTPARVLAYEPIGSS